MMPAQQARARSGLRGTSPGFSARGSSVGSVIPFDHAASFELRGIPGNIVQDVINISTDGVFVAVAIGYGFEEDRARSVTLSAAQTGQSELVGDITLSQIPTIALIEGFRLNPQLNRVAFDASSTVSRGRSVPAREPSLTTNPIVTTFSSSIIERIKPVDEISFLFSIVDTGTGRELQDEPIHNLASLGISDGSRPFRMLAQPLTFQPRSTVRLQIVERSEGIQGTLFIVLYGYKIFDGFSGRSPRTVSTPLGSQGRTNANGDGRIIPFDYVSKFQLTGRPGNLIEDEVPINTEGGFVATSIGYGLATDNLSVSIRGLPSIPDPPANPPSVDLGDITLRQFPTSALLEGVRIRPNFLRIAFNDNGLLNTSLAVTNVSQLFERLSRPETVSFRYSIAETATGRELQNQPIHNVAGLGIANGDRPFKHLAWPMTFLPRSTIRVTVEERFGRGTLFIVFQGYKRLSASPRAPLSSSSRRSRRR